MLKGEKRIKRKKERKNGKDEDKNKYKIKEVPKVLTILLSYLRILVLFIDRRCSSIILLIIPHCSSLYRYMPTYSYTTSSVFLFARSNGVNA